MLNCFGVLILKKMSYQIPQDIHVSYCVINENFLEAAYTARERQCDGCGMVKSARDFVCNIKESISCGV